MDPLGLLPRSPWCIGHHYHLLHLAIVIHVTSFIAFCSVMMGAPQPSTDHLHQHHHHCYTTRYVLALLTSTSLCTHMATPLHTCRYQQPKLPPRLFCVVRAIARLIDRLHWVGHCLSLSHLPQCIHQPTVRTNSGALDPVPWLTRETSLDKLQASSQVMFLFFAWLHSSYGSSYLSLFCPISLENCSQSCLVCWPFHFWGQPHADLSTVLCTFTGRSGFDFRKRRYCGRQYQLA